jgi:plastocyanin
LILKGAAFAALLSLAACGGGGGGGSSSSGPSGPPPPPPNTIYVGTPSDGYGNGSSVFTPTNLTVAVGATVTWEWQGSNHAVESGTTCTADSQFSSGGVHNSGYTMTHTFNTAGTYPFFCTTHCGQNMKGTITVQ